MGYIQISGKISREDKEKIRVLVKKGMFSSMSEFYRIAVGRLLKDLETHREKAAKKKEEILSKPEEKIENAMKDITKFADELY